MDFVVELPHAGGRDTAAIAEAKDGVDGFDFARMFVLSIYLAS